MKNARSSWKKLQFFKLNILAVQSDASMTTTAENISVIVVNVDPMIISIKAVSNIQVNER